MKAFISCRDGAVRPVFGKKRVRPFFVDNAVGRSCSCCPLLIFGIFDIRQNKNERTCLAGSKKDVDLLRCDRRPAACNRISAGAVQHCLRSLRAVVEAHKFGTDRIKTVHLRVYGIERVVIAALPVLGLVIDRRAAVLDFHFAGGKVPLEILAVVRSVPQTPLDIGEKPDCLRL